MSTIRQALAEYRSELRDRDIDYMPSHIEPTKLADGTWLQVERTPASDGGILLGCFRFRRTEDESGRYRLTSWRAL